MASSVQAPPKPSRRPSVRGPLPPDDELVPALLEGDDRAFALILDSWSPGLRRLARRFCRSDDVADEVVQETWKAVITGLPRFEGRSSLKTWVFTIVANRARTRATREGRTVPLSSIGSADEDGGLDADRFASGGGWLRPPSGWAVDSPESLTLALEGSGLVSRVLEGIPPMQATVVTLRDVDGLGSKEVCNLLEITESNQRVLLHRGRARLRAAIEEWLAGEANQAED